MEWGILYINPAMQNKVLSFLQNTFWKRRGGEKKKKEKTCVKGVIFKCVLQLLNTPWKLKYKLSKTWMKTLSILKSVSPNEGGDFGSLEFSFKRS